MVIRLSRFTHSIFGPNGILLFHSLSLDHIYLSKDLYILITDLLRNAWTDRATFIKYLLTHGVHAPYEFIDALEAAGFIINSEDTDNAMLKSVRSRFTHLPEIDLLYIIHGFDCNLRCNYCMVRSPRTAIVTGQLRLDDQIRGIKEVLDGQGNQSHPFRILYYGGEPLLYFDAIVKTTRMLCKETECSRPLEFGMVTNGTLIDPLKAKWFAENKFSIGISIDGYSDVHDFYRKTADGRGSFEAAKRGFLVLREAGCEPSLSCTVSDNSLDRFMQNLEMIVRELSPKTIGFNPLVTAADRGDYIGSDYARRFAEQAYLGWKMLRDRGIYEDKCMRIIESLVDKRVRYNDCGACGNQLVILPDGRFTICHALSMHSEYSYNSPVSDLRLQNDLLRWARRSPLNTAGCENCMAVGVCGGGCPYRVLQENGSIEDIDQQHCYFARHVIESFLRDLCIEQEKYAGTDSVG